MRQITSLLSLLMISILVLVAGLSCQQKTRGKVLVEVGSEVITEPDLELLIRVNPRLKRRIATPAGKKQILDNYVEQALMYQEAKKQGLARDPLVSAKIDLYRKVILAQALLEAALEEETKKYFDEHQGEFEKVKIAHIYIPFKTKEKNRALSKDANVKRSERQAKEKIAKLTLDLKANPDKFTELAEKDSEDARTQKRGGDLGWLALNDARMGRWGWALVVEKSFPLAVGTISEPIRSDNGYHLVKVVAGKKTDDFDQIKARVRFKIQSQIKSGLVNELKKQYKVSYAGEQG